MVINHIMCTSKILTDLFHKTKHKKKNFFCKRCLWCFSSENVLKNHEKDYLSINGLQSVGLEKGTIEFKKYLKQIPVSFKIYVDFECNLETAEIYEGSYSKKHQNHIPCSFAYKVVCIGDNFTKPVVAFRGELKWLKWFLKSMNTIKK